MSSQSHITSSVLINLDRLHSFWDCGTTLQSPRIEISTLSTGFF